MWWLWDYFHLALTINSRYNIIHSKDRFLCCCICGWGSYCFTWNSLEGWSCVNDNGLWNVPHSRTFPFKAVPCTSPSQLATSLWGSSAVNPVTLITTSHILSECFFWSLHSLECGMTRNVLVHFWSHLTEASTTHSLVTQFSVTISRSGDPSQYTETPNKAWSLQVFWMCCKSVMWKWKGT